jgi:hypothetical protein
MDDADDFDSIRHNNVVQNVSESSASDRAHILPNSRVQAWIGLKPVKNLLDLQ